MEFQLNDVEAEGLRLIPVGDLVDLAVDLDFIPGAEIDRRELIEKLLPRLLERARSEGLPFSKYDREDLEALNSEHRQALAEAMGWPTDTASILKGGAKVYKLYTKQRPGSQVALLLPLLLESLARYAFETR